MTGVVVDAVGRFARKTAEQCVHQWTRDETIAAMRNFSAEHEQEVVKHIENIQLEILEGERE